MSDGGREQGDGAARPRRVLLLGATGTIGRATARALAARGHEVVCCIRPQPRAGAAAARNAALPDGCETRSCDVADPLSLRRDGFRSEAFDAVVSCLASRTGAPEDAWAIDHQAHIHALEAAREAGVTHFVLVSAICVQKPELAFQRAKLAFEKALIESGLAYSIVRPTAYFKSLSGQVARVKAGKPFLVFGDGRLTATKPISDEDLADYLAGCLEDPARRNRILPIGGPGPAITPREQGEHLFRLLGRAPRFRSVPVGVIDGIVATLDALARLAPPLRAKAEFARIARHYATQSMLVIDPATGRHSAEATPSHGADTLFEHYARLLRGEAGADLADHAIFDARVTPRETEAAP